MELCHFFFSSALSGTFRTLINIYDGYSYNYDDYTGNYSYW